MHSHNFHEFSSLATGSYNLSHAFKEKKNQWSMIIMEAVLEALLRAQSEAGPGGGQNVEDNFMDISEVELMAWCI